MDWKESIRDWRALPEEEKHRLRWESIPRNVARSFAFAGEPVDLALLEAEHARTPMPPVAEQLTAGASSRGNVTEPPPPTTGEPS
jgi:hypothetical protein